ncbi:MAG: elongation factor P [Candidatus Aquicultor secundus]|uniref:Elongation factor P n=1 Tax=Candidatus Aquicultor secundus TaxID=1973895 RepID=A0A2M7T641_9ACTN|nr:elongation factor P [Candidatus Aquicultor secundus]NCO66083.1 elongation factor P [Solirubrobacter sp.]OIO87703.1 MAG: elongation factor P [Candidatus Aquicultor secundus]PIU27895.1 MAG: elongation factor P [Candidatus Aquicultor secundus]PIW22404.1 MAG: elongation factor P [Candidatus Aquicultor secundus]PIX53026.1 MAG: elongation factor P [Candidatus Aquicultor secundus]
MISTNQFKNGMTIELDGTLFQIVEFQHVKPGKGGAFVRTKLRNFKTGGVVDKTFRAGEKVEQAMVNRRSMQYLYNDGSDYVFMDTETYEQISLPASFLQDETKFMKENMNVLIAMHEGQALGIELPTAVELEVTHTEPGVKGDTASGGTKPATLETGAVVQVPLFINVGDMIKVDTRTGDYITRV